MTISRVFNTISKVFNIFSEVVASRSNLVGAGTLSTRYRVLQGIDPLRKGSKVLQVGLSRINDNLWGHRKSMLASMTISSTISPFVIDDNNSCSPCEHAPLLSSSLPLWHQWKRVSTYLCLKSLTTTHCSPYQYARS